MKKFLALLTLAAMLAPALAQNGFDTYEIPRTLLVASPKVITATTTNTAVDVRMFTGVVKVDLIGVTNSAADSLTATFETSADKSTWANLGNISIANATSIQCTNRYYGTNGLGVTQTFNLPGTITTPTAATAGWYSSYIAASAPYTNSGAIDVTGSGGGAVKTIGFSVDNAQRYIRVIWTVGAGNTNGNEVAAILTGRTVNGRLESP